MNILYLWVGVGGAIGAMMRYWMVSLLAPISLAGQFPYGTLSVNIIGSLLMGLVVGVLSKMQDGGYVSSAAYLFFATGVLGGFTTFSAFSLDAVQMIARGAMLPAALYIVASVAGGIVALWGALLVVR